jgi:hypothetical protein
MLNSRSREVPKPICFLVIAQDIVQFHGLGKLARFFGRGAIGFRCEDIRVDA